MKGCPAAGNYYVCLSFSLLDDEENVLSAKGVHTVAIINAHTKTSLPNLQMILTHFLKAEVNGEPIKLEFFLGGDYKFLLLVCGLSSAASNQYCKDGTPQRVKLTTMKLPWPDPLKN